MANILKPGDIPPTDPDTPAADYVEGRAGWEYDLDIISADNTSDRIDVLRRVISEAPYQRGDVIWTLDSDYEPRRAVVIKVFRERLVDSIIPKYRVSLLRKDGKGWSMRWKYAYPGTIGRAYEAIEN